MWYLCRDRLLTRSALGLVFLVFSFSPALSNEPHSEIILKSDWPEYVNGANVSALPQITSILKRFEEEENRIIIRHPESNSGRQWGESVLRWLISFGIPGEYFELLPGSGAENQIIITLTNLG